MTCGDRGVALAILFWYLPVPGILRFLAFIYCGTYFLSSLGLPQQSLSCCLQPRTLTKAELK